MNDVTSFQQCRCNNNPVTFLRNGWITEA